MKQRRFLLLTAALTAASAETACGKKEAAKPDTSSGEVLPLPANPKGSFYDAGMISPIDPSADAGAEPASADAAVRPDAGAEPASADAAVRPDAGPSKILKVHPLPANPKGSHYDRGPKKPTDPER